MLIATLAACSHSPDTQGVLTNEIKAALARVLSMPESAEKHNRIQVLMTVITSIIEACPGASTTSTRGQQQQHNSMNNIVKVLLRRGVVADLARIPHSLDLSSPLVATTMNAALKPLEILSRIINSPGPLSSTNAKTGKNKTEQELDETTTEQPSNRAGESTSETIAQAEEIIGDTDNTEQDISVAEPTSESREDEGVLDELIDQLTNRNAVSDVEEEVLADVIIAEATARDRMDTDETLNDSTMQGESEFEGDETRGEDDDEDDDDDGGGDSGTSSESEVDGEEHVDEGKSAPCINKAV